MESWADENQPARSIQTISGTGANHYGGAFLSRFYEPWLGKSKEEKKIYLSNPTWGESSFDWTG